MRAFSLLALLALLWPTLAPAQSFSGGFPFYLPANDSSTQRFLPVFPAFTISEFIQVSPDGHFSSGGQPIRFWGVNVTTGACFPLEEKAAGIAGRMRKMGINLVRFHHMDNPWTDNNGAIFRREWNSTRQLNPVTFDRFHYFLAQLKNNGIYANLNLHVSRTFKPGDGVLYADSIPEFGKAVTLFDRHLIGLQKEYARQLLRTVNPYTGLALADDPVLGMVEITNENTLYGFWRDDQLQPFARGGMLLKRHSDSLDLRWQMFLREKYGSQEALQAAWSGGTRPPGQGEQIADGQFENTQLGSNWQLEQHEGAQATVSVDATRPYAGRYSARVQVNRISGTDWHVQFKRTALSIRRDSAYVIRFAARADRAREINVSIMRDNSPWTWYTGRSLNLSTEWQVFTVSITAPEENLGQVRISFALGQAAGSVWFDAASMADPEVQGLAAGESLSAGNIRRMPYSERQLYHPRRLADQAEFYLDLQSRYYEEMGQFLRDSLRVKVPITGSNALGGPGETYSMRSLDYIDDHAYWDHPLFPGEPWSPTNWLISNTSMLRDGRLGTVPGIFGGLAVAGKPYTISEYNHGYPNRFQVEMMPVLAAYSSLHDVDGIMFFDYNGDYADWENDRIGGYFSIHRNSAIMALSPLFAHAYRWGLLQTAPPLTINYPPSYLFEQMPRADNQGRWGKFFPYDPALAITQHIRTAGFSDAPAPDWEGLPSPGAAPYQTVSGQTYFDPGKGLLRINAPELACLAGPLNQLAGETAGPLALKSGTEFGVMAWLSLDGEPLAQSKRSMIALSSRAQNTGMGWEGTRTVRDRWGQSPTLVQAQFAELSLQIEADSIRLYRLDEKGKEGSSRIYRPGPDGRFFITLNQQTDQTLWYGIESFRSTVSRAEIRQPRLEFQLFPNPAPEEIWVEYERPGPGPIQLELLDGSGRVIRRLNLPDGNDGRQQFRLATENLSSGTYWIRLKYQQIQGVKSWIKK